ncbi:MAG TPA: TonB-dependent receptor [Steroidobacteraceae bacterium]|nr:TonB-dependent receptor [Steroidobacteraceae bacterium]
MKPSYRRRRAQHFDCVPATIDLRLWHARSTPLAQSVALALGLAAAPFAYAQTAAAPAASTLEEVVITGIRASLASSQNLKRNAQGVVDGIVAEDIGKFPDTNLAESMQRITGVSIDRVNGEGSKITVRGIGPDYNLVLLNGRQMPGANIEATNVSNSRSFDFANLASEAIAAIEVHKTSRADTATGGIGATVNIKTARPLDSHRRVAEFGIKGVTDRSNANLPSDFKGSTFTPEISGIYSDTFADNTFGVAITASYQDRAAGYNQASVQSGYHSICDQAPTPDNGCGGGNDWGSIAGASNVTNRPTGIYQVPQDLRYLITGIERKRTNGQLTLQYRPIDSVTATLDYTYSENKIATKRQEISAWFGFGPNTVSSWTSGNPAGPLSYSEPSLYQPVPGGPLVPGCLVPAGPGCADVAMARSDFATKAENKSTGFNLRWEATDRLNFEFDAHDSTATSGADGLLGSNNTLGMSAYVRGTTTVDFTHDFPVLSIDLPPLNGVIDPAYAEVTGSSFRNSYTKAEVQQEQLKGDWKFAEKSRLDFGVSLTDVKNRSAFSNNEQDNWGGLGNPSMYPDSAFTLDSIRHYFSNISGSSNPALFNQYFNWDFNGIRAAAIQVWDAHYGTNGAALFQANPNFTTDRDTKETSKSAYLQYSTAFDMGLPAHFAAGVRYEKTDVTSRALVPIATGDVWGSANEFSIQFGAPGFTTLKGSYSYALPSLDFDIDLTPQLKARASWGKSIGRPGWGDIQGGQTLSQGARNPGGTGSQGNPALKPLEAKNIDLSLEWYYDKASYVSLGYFKKDVSNYTGYSQINSTPFNVPNPGANGSGPGGAISPWVAEAVTSGCLLTDNVCIRDYIFTTYGGPGGDPAVVRGPLDSNGHYTGTIAGRPGIDPATNFVITIPVNATSANVDGWEIALQHMFGDTGFGADVNFTYVNSGLKFNNASLKAQFALIGLSNSANVVAFYENAKWEVRAAYNWRDQFYSGNDGFGSPVYQEPFGQIDANVGYKFSDRLSVQVEAINLTDRNQRSHSRTRQAVEYATQTGARYMIGARYQLGK